MIIKNTVSSREIIVPRSQTIQHVFSFPTIESVYRFLQKSKNPQEKKIRLEAARLRDAPSPYFTPAHTVCGSDPDQNNRTLRNKPEHSTVPADRRERREYTVWEEQQPAY
jgi:hypothetical protein